MKAMGAFKNNFQSNMLSREISQFHNRGFASASKVQTILNIIREQQEIKHLKNIDPDKVQEIAREIAERVADNDITGKTGATYISALNQVIDYVNHFFDKKIEQLKYSDFDIHKDTDYSDKSISSETHNNFQNYLSEKFEQTNDSRFERLQHAVELQREFGLRARESFGLSKESIEKALETGKLSLDRSDWTKNARERQIDIKTPEQRETLQKVQNLLSENNLKSLAGEKNDIKDIKSFKNFAYKEATSQGFNFHSERHHWAQSQYSTKWEQKTGVGIQSPIKYYSSELQAKNWTGEGKFYDAVKEHSITNWFEYTKEETNLSIHEIKEIDREIRMEISEELGHSRLDITNTYLGHP